MNGEWTIVIFLLSKSESLSVLKAKVVTLPGLQGGQAQRSGVIAPKAAGPREEKPVQFTTCSCLRTI